MIKKGVTPSAGHPGNCLKTGMLEKKKGVTGSIIEKDCNPTGAGSSSLKA